MQSSSFHKIKRNQFHTIVCLQPILFPKSCTIKIKVSLSWQVGRHQNPIIHIPPMILRMLLSSFQDNFNLLRVNILKIYKEVPASSALAKSFLYSQSMGVSAHSPLTLCNPMDCSPPGSPVHGILQARIIGVGTHFLLQRR